MIGLLCICVYVAISVLYTSYRLPTFFGQRFPPRDISTPSILLWPSSPWALQHGLGSRIPTPMSEDRFLARAFPDSPDSELFPFFYRSAPPADPNDVTITTLITPDRFPVFARLVERYNGPISVTVHLAPGPALPSELRALHALYTSSPRMPEHVDVHVALSRAPRQLNAWRNLARLAARTAYIMMLDVDFVPCTDFRASVRAAVRAARTPGPAGAVGRALADGTAALVVPAFEFVDQDEGTRYDAFPRDKETLRTLVAAGRLAMFHAAWAPGHNATDYPRFYAAPPGGVYRVTQHHPAYEPYVIFKRDGPPWCAERFTGYGANKAACLFELRAAGTELFVLADHWLVHTAHAYAEAARRDERKINRRVYSEFVEEVCLRYLSAYTAQGLLDSPRGQTLVAQCSAAVRSAR